MQIAEMRKFISSLLVAHQELEVPDWVTIRRWKEKIEARELPFEEGIRQLMEIHYDMSFGAADPVRSLGQVSKYTGLTVKTIKAKAREVIFQWGRPYVIRLEDYQRIFKGGD